MTLGRDREDNLLGPGQARSSPQGPHDSGLLPPQVGVRHGGGCHSMERQLGDQRAEGTETLFRLKIKKDQKIHDLQPKKGGFIF